MDPDTLDTVAQHLLPPRVIPPGANPFQTPGGAYFYLDDKDRAVVSMNRQIFVVAIEGNTLRRVRTYDLCELRPGRRPAQLGAARLEGAALVRDPPPRDRRRARTRAPASCSGRYRTGEAIGNSFAMDETGGVFVVTDRAQYRFDLDRDGEAEA